MRDQNSEVVSCRKTGMLRNDPGGITPIDSTAGLDSTGDGSGADISGTDDGVVVAQGDLVEPLPELLEPRVNDLLLPSRVGHEPSEST